MNILAEEQLKIFETGLTDEERILREEKFNNLYFQLRHKDETGFFGRMSHKSRKRIHWLILAIYTIKNRIGRFTYEIIDDKRTKSDRPIIFAVTHVGKFDIEVIS